MSKEQFKDFVKKNPNLIKHVSNNSMSWQKFYEIYEMYGENNEIWNQYTNNNEKKATENKNMTVDKSFKEIVQMVKNINLEKVQKGIDSIQKTISLVQDFGGGNATNNQYEKRPIYKHFED